MGLRKERKDLTAVFHGGSIQPFGGYGETNATLLYKQTDYRGYAIVRRVKG